MTARRALLWASVALTAVYAVRAGFGFVAGLSYSEGRKLARDGYYEAALPLLDRSAVGELRPELRWLAGQTRVGLWEQRIAEGVDPGDVEDLFDGAYRDATAALAASPANGWHWMALGDLYHRNERLEAHRAGVPLSLLDQDPWTRVGHSGRVAIGLMRIGLQREPNWYDFHDQLAYVYYHYALEAETLDAVYRSALALPVYELHPYRTLRPPDPRILDAFARGAEDSVGRVPWLRPVLHSIALGRIEARRGRWVEAEAHLEAALAGSTIPLNVAEIHYYRGLARIGQGRLDAAFEDLVEAEAAAPFEPLAVISEADLRERQGRWEEALGLWRRARRLQPKRLDVSIRLIAAAVRLERNDVATQEIREALRIHPRRPEPRVELVRQRLREGNLAKATRALEELRELAPGDPSIPALQRRLSDPAPVSPYGRLTGEK